MANNWQTLSLAEVYDFSSGLSKPRAEFGSGSPFLSFKDIFYNSAVPKQLKELVQSTEQEQERYSVIRGDVFLTRTSETLNELGMSSVALSNIPYATFNGFAKRLRPKNGLIAPEFARYFFRSPKFRNAINSMSTMSTRASLNNEMLEKLTITFPEYALQEAIGHILGTLDDKIELNHSMNETLEGISLSLFNAWFVDFKPVRMKMLGGWQRGQSLPGLPSNLHTLFPDHLVSTEKGEIPAGWEVVKVESLLERLPAKSRYTKDQVTKYGSTPVFEQGASIILGYHNATPTYQVSVDDPAFIFGDHTCLFRLSCQPFDISQNVIPLRGRGRPTIWVYYAVKDKQKFQEYRRHWMELVAKDVVKAPEDVCLEFSKKISIQHCKMEQNERESCSLAQLRDTLLPNLVSGQLRIPDAERIVGAAI